MNNWIDIDKELPKQGQEVDVWLTKHDISGRATKRITDCWYSEKHGFMKDSCVVSLHYPFHITHWMPTPKPPGQ